MKTVIENDADLDRCYPGTDERENCLIHEFDLGRSCFYDFGAKNPVVFSGYSKDGDSEFINKVMNFFQL